jgi:FMN phosphatase YigB (HAD superfamily)
VVLLDVDKTLLDNDAIIDELRAHLMQAYGADTAERYWACFEALRNELGYADYLGALQRYRVEADSDPRLLSMSSYLIDYPFATRLYAGALTTLASARRHGPTVILSDGDAVFQPRKIQRSGLWDAVEGRVLVYIHKEKVLADMMRRHPARRYVMVDDKLRILSAMKAVLQDRLATVFVRQGHYARDLAAISALPGADFTIERIADFAAVDLG